MLTGEIRNQIDCIWDAFWSGGIAKQQTSAAVRGNSQSEHKPRLQALAAQAVLQNGASSGVDAVTLPKAAEVGGTRLELVTSTMSTLRSNQLS